MFTEDALYAIALTMAPGLGDKTLRQLTEYFGSPGELARAPRKALLAIEGMGETRADALCKTLADAGVMKRAEEELAFLERIGGRVLLQQDPDYPSRMLQCADAPFVLYARCEARLNAGKIVAIVGTRKPSDYGVQLCEALVAGLPTDDTLVVSGLAHGIDTVAHRQSVATGKKTLGVVAHGLDQIYPPANRQLAADMTAQGGGILTEFMTGTRPDKGNFPVRNRIVAGMSDVTVVVESDVKGGAMITAYLAHSYNREVAAFPGRVGDSRAAGCNQLIRRTVAGLITSADELSEMMGWGTVQQKVVQPKLLLAFSAEEQCLVDVLQEAEKVHADDLLVRSGMNPSMLASVLLQLEMQGVVRSLPGKNYRLA